jgi:hypothetical protein
LFSEHDKEWIYGILTDVDCNYKKPFCTNAQDWDHIKEIPDATKGTITAVPLELVNGSAYMFDYDHCRSIGMYHKLLNKLESIDRFYNADNCTNIKIMVEK